MGSDWREQDLGATVEILTGYPFKSSEFTDAPDGIRLLRGDNVAQGFLRWEGVKRWPAEHSDDLRKFTLARDDIVLAMDRPWIDAGLKQAAVRDADIPSLLVQRVARLRAKADLDQSFLRYLIASPAFAGHVLSVQTGTAVPHISPSQIRAFRFALPPLEEQRRIAGVLTALGDKIEQLNRRSGLLDQTLRLFGRGRLRDGSPDWPQGRLGDHFTVSRGLSYTGAGLVEDAESGQPLHNLNSVLEGGGYKFSGIKYYSGDFKDRHRVRAGDLVVANTEQGFEELLIGFPAIIPSTFGEDGIFSHHLHRVLPTDSTYLSSYWLYLWLLDARNHDLIAGYANGTTVNMLPTAALENPTVPIPPEDRIREIDSVAVPIIASHEACQRESATLIAIRDALLPKLISGAIRVPDSYDPDDVLGSISEEAGVPV